VTRIADAAQEQNGAEQHRGDDDRLAEPLTLSEPLSRFLGSQRRLSWEASARGR
jgi:hypothetical protein